MTGRTMDFVKAREARIQGLTKEMVDKAIKTLVDRDQMITVAAGDFNGKPQADKKSEPSGDSDSK
jgi:predicted Zn-dependent peptidase